MQMAQSSEDKFLDVAWHEGTTNTPILDGSLCHVECKLITEHDAGDHTLAIGEVLDYQANEHKSSPLLFFRGKVLGSLNEQVS